MDTQKTVVDQQWHIVCGSMEIEELERYSLITPWQAKDHRHSLFLTMKYPEHRFYKGTWGPELLHFVNEGEYRGSVGKIYCTYARYTDIAKWFLTNMFPA